MSWERRGDRYVGRCDDCGMVVDTTSPSDVHRSRQLIWVFDHTREGHVDGALADLCPSCFEGRLP